MSDSELVLYGFCAGFFVAELLLVWVLRSLPRRRSNPNPFGELPPIKPLGDEAERWTYAVVDDGSIYVGEAPKPLVSEQSLITAIAIRHNQPEARN